MKGMLYTLQVLTYQPCAMSCYTSYITTCTIEILCKTLTNKFPAHNLLGMKFPGREEVEENREENILRKSILFIVINVPK